MDWHEDCTAEFCLAPLHKGPCKGTHRAGGGAAKKAPRARKVAAPKKAVGQKRASGPTIKSGTAARDIANLAEGIDGGKFGESLAQDLAAATTPEARNQAITAASLQLGRVLANSRASKASPAGRRKLTGFLARKANDAIRSGDSASMKELLGKLGKNVTDSDIDALTGTSRSVTAAGKPPKRYGWKGMLAPINKPTGDGRMFAPDALSNRDLPLPLRFQRADGGGHGGAVVVGRILSIEYHADHAYATGDWLDPDITPEVTEAQEWSRKKVIGPSVDLDDAVMELVPASVEAATEDCGCDDTELSDKGDSGEQPMIKLVTRGRISGATLVQIPAFAECHALEMSDEEDPETQLAVPQPGDPVGLAAETADTEDDVAYFVSLSDDKEWATVVRDDGAVERVSAGRLRTSQADDAEAWEDALLAAADPGSWLIAAALAGPPAAWFADPKLPGATPLTVTEDGRVFGHLAQWGVCHIGKPGCVTAPSSRANYAYFHTGEVVTAEGQAIDVGKITLGTGHADAESGFRAAAEHYDHSGSCAAVVRAGEDAYGIWIAGALTVPTDDHRCAELRRSPLSGDWRRVGNGLELVAALAVNVPGFPVPRSRFAAGRTLSLVAAGSLSAQARDKAAAKGAALPDGSFPIRDVGELHKAVKLAGNAKDPAAAKAHIRKRAKALGATDAIPASWATDDDPESVFRRLMANRDRFANLDAAFGQVEATQAQTRVETAAALLAFLE